MTKWIAIFRKRQLTVKPLTKTVGSGAMYLGVAQFLRMSLSIGSAITIARILLPSDYGVAAMATPIIGFVQLFQDIGISQATIQARELDDRQSTTLFWVNIALSGAVCLILFALAPAAAYFYKDWRPGAFTAASALSVLVSGASMQHLALIERRMDFRAVALIDMAGAFVGFAATLAAAVILRSFWAIWLGGLAAAVCSTALLWTANPWRPGRRMHIQSVRNILHFGGGLTGFNTFNFLTRNLDNVLIAKFNGAAELGLYDRSYKLLMLPLQNINGPLGRLLLPTLARLQDEPARYRRVFLVTVGMLMLLVVPAVTVSAALSDRLIVFLLGARWAAAGPIYFWLSLVGLISPLSNATGWLFIGSGRTGAMAKWAIFSGIFTIAGFAVGLKWGAVGVAASFFVTVALRMPILFSYCTAGTSVSTSDLYRVLVAPAAAAAVTFVLVRLLEPFLSIVPLLAIGLALAYLVAIGCCALTKVGRDTLARTHELLFLGLAKFRRRPSTGRVNVEVGE